MLYIYVKTMGLISRARQGARWAGQSIADLDARYADALYNDDMGPISAMSRTVPLS